MNYNTLYDRQTNSVLELRSASMNSIQYVNTAH
jgi:hypothetical protein